MRFLIDSGAEINCLSKKVGMTPMHWAAYHNDRSILLELLHLKTSQKATFLSRNQQKGE